MRALTLLALTACQPSGSPREATTATCLVDPPTTGVWVQERLCAEQTPPMGEGTIGDVVLANRAMRALIRQPAHALTVPGIGGGTLVDLAPWDHRDVLHEAIPLVQGGWLELDSYELLEDGVRVEGEVRPLLDRPFTPGRGTVEWRMLPDGEGLSLSGANALWLNPHPDMDWEEQALVGTDTTLTFDGVVAEDLGGARIIEGLTHIAAVPTASRWAEEPGAIRVSGEAPDATHLVLAAGGAEVMRWRIEGSFEGWAPPGVDAVRASAPTLPPSAWESPGEDLMLSLGEPGSLVVEGPSRMALRWWADGRGGLAVVDPGQSVAVGAGEVTAEVDGLEQAVTVPARGEVTVVGDGIVDRGNWVRVDLDLPASRDFRTRTSSYASALWAWYGGASHGVLLAENDIADPTSAALSTSTGTRMKRDGWAVDAFPWAGTARLGAHGALDPALVPLDSVIAALRGGPGTDRTMLADLAFLEAHGPFDPEALAPDAVRLTFPSEDPAATWEPWLLMDAPSRPVGPVTWIWTPDPAIVGELEVRRALARGATVAGSGVWLSTEVDGEDHGTELPDGIYEVTIAWEGDLDEVVLLDGTREITRWDGERAPWQVQTDAESLVVVGWSAAGDWVVSHARRRAPLP